MHGWQTQTLLRVNAVRAKYISRHEIIFWFSVHVAIVDLGAEAIAYDAEILVNFSIHIALGDATATSTAFTAKTLVRLLCKLLLGTLLLLQPLIL